MNKRREHLALRLGYQAELQLKSLLNGLDALSIVPVEDYQLEDLENLAKAIVKKIEFLRKTKKGKA